MSTIKCPHCGKVLPSESAFCPYCMEQIKEPVAVSVPATKGNKGLPLMVLITIVLLLIVAVVVLVGFFGGKGERNGIPSDATTDKKASVTTDALDNTTSDEAIYGESTATEPQTSGNVTEITTEGVTDNTTGNVTENITEGATEGKMEGITPAEPTTEKNNSQGGQINTPTNAPQPSGCSHSYVAQYETVYHEEEGHYEDVDRSRPITMYRCPMCYKDHYSLNLYYTHFDTIHVPSYPGDPIGMFRDQYTTDIEYEYYTERIWVVDREAYDEEVITGYKCSKCGKMR